MANTFIVHHNESIYAHAHTEEKGFAKPNIYLERKRKKGYIADQQQQQQLWKTQEIYKNRTMGPAQISLYPPSDYLKKNDGEKLRIRNVPDHKCIKITEKYKIPKCYELTRLPPCRDINFIAKNIELIQNSKPKRYCPKFAYTVKGDVHKLAESGMMPEYIFHPNYGKIPQYIYEFEKEREEERKRIEAETTKINCSIKDAYKYAEYLAQLKKDRRGENCNRQYVQFDDGKKKTERSRKPKKDDLCQMQQLSQEERMNILTGLKQKWKELMSIYLKHTVSTKITENKDVAILFKNLDDLEKDIIFLESNPLIFIKE